MATPEKKYQDRVVKIRSKHPLPDKALVAPGYGGWAAYFDGVIVAKCTPCFKPEAVLLQDIADIELQAPRGLRNGVLKITVGTAEANPKTINFNFLKDEKPAFVHLRDVLTAENQRGVTGELPPEYRIAVKEESSPGLQQPAHAAPLMGTSDENSVVFERDDEQAFLALRDAIELAQRALHASRPDASTPLPQEDILGRLEKLSSLRDAGILTEEEFTAKKAELLGRL